MSLLLALCGEEAGGLFFCCDDYSFSLNFAASSNAEQCLVFRFGNQNQDVYGNVCYTDNSFS